MQKQVKLCLRQDSNSTTDPITNVFTDDHLVGALETIRISQSNINWHFSRAVQSISSLFSIITLFIHQYDIVGNNDENIISTTPLLSLHPRKRPSPNIWVTMKQPVEIENEIGDRFFIIFQLTFNALSGISSRISILCNIKAERKSEVIPFLFNRNKINLKRISTSGNIRFLFSKQYNS